MLYEVITVFLFFLGLKIARTNLNLEEKSKQTANSEGIKRNNGFLTGFAINFLNPTLFV